MEAKSETRFEGREVSIEGDGDLVTLKVVGCLKSRILGMSSTEEIGKQRSFEHVEGETRAQYGMTEHFLSMGRFFNVTRVGERKRPLATCEYLRKKKVKKEKKEIKYPSWARAASLWALLNKWSRMAASLSRVSSVTRNFVVQMEQRSASTATPSSPLKSLESLTMNPST
jgi:hypothetical protein